MFIFVVEYKASELWDHIYYASTKKLKITENNFKHMYNFYATNCYIYVDSKSFVDLSEEVMILRFWII